MSTSRVKQIAQKRRGKTKKSGNGSRTNASKRKKMNKSSTKHFTGKKR